MLRRRAGPLLKTFCAFMSCLEGSYGHALIIKYYKNFELKVFIGHLLTSSLKQKINIFKGCSDGANNLFQQNKELPNHCHCFNEIIKKKTYLHESITNTTSSIVILVSAMLVAKII